MGNKLIRGTSINGVEEQRVIGTSIVNDCDETESRKHQITHIIRVEAGQVLTI